jgi:hypothetical protein
LWTLARIARLIKQHFGIRYHPGHVWKLLRKLGWSCQKPERRALQRDEAAIAHWKRYLWPHIRRRANALGAWLVFVDESGFLLIPNVKRTWAPKGETPTVRYLLNHKKMSSIGSMSPPVFTSYVTMPTGCGLPTLPTNRTARSLKMDLRIRLCG